MPDATKLEKLAEIGYTITPTCRLCQNGRFNPASDFGRCVTHLYDHGKHDGLKQLSVHQSGSCADDFEFNLKKSASVERSGFTPFLLAQIKKRGEG